MYTVQTRVTFEAAHRLYDVDTYSKECSDSVHGHSYAVTIVVGREDLNDAGMVIDFKLLKKVIKEVIEDQYDHSLILRTCDPLLAAFAKLAPEQKMNVTTESPTAEWMAESFASLLSCRFALEDDELRVQSVSVQETENNIATWRA